MVLDYTGYAVPYVFHGFSSSPLISTPVHNISFESKRDTRAHMHYHVAHLKATGATERERQRDSRACGVSEINFVNGSQAQIPNTHAPKPRRSGMAAAAANDDDPLCGPVQLLANAHIHTQTNTNQHSVVLGMRCTICPDTVDALLPCVFDARTCTARCVVRRRPLLFKRQVKDERRDAAESAYVSCAFSFVCCA